MLRVDLSVSLLLGILIYRCLYHVLVGILMRDHTDDELLLMLAAYAYEKHAHSLITDAEFDQRCLALADAGTTIPDFQPDTGMWVHHHQVADRALMYVTDRIVEILGRAPDWEWRASAIAELRHLQKLLDNQN